MMRNTTLYDAAKVGDLEDIKHRINEQNVNSYYGIGNTILHIAVSYGHIEIIKYLLTIPGININVKQNMALCHSPLHIAAIDNNCEIVELLTSHGANINIQNFYRETPLHVAAAIKYSEETIKCLLKHRASVNIQDNNGQTPLHAAVIKNNEIATYLLTSTHRADVNIQDNNHNIPIYYAIAGGNKNITKILLCHYPNINAQCIDYDNTNNTILHIAAIFGKTDIADILLDNGADINSKNSSNNTALSLAINKWNNQPDEYRPIIRLFISHIIQLKHFDTNINLEALEEHNDLINNRPELEQYKQEYEQEIQLMKSIKVDSSSESLFDILKDKNRLARNVDNSNLIDRYNEFQLLQKYINKCMKEATTRNEYIKKASDEQIIKNWHLYLDNLSTTSQVFWNKLAPELKKEVLEKLSNAELKTLQPIDDAAGAEAEVGGAHAIYE